MSIETLIQKEKELIAVACAVSAGCQRCSNYHFKKAFESGAKQDEVKTAVEQATDSIRHADEMMQRKAYALMEVTRQEVPLTIATTDRLTALVKLGAAVASNCTPTITEHLAAAHSSSATESEIKVTMKLAKMVLNKASEFADQAIDDALGNPPIFNRS